MSLIGEPHGHDDHLENIDHIDHAEGNPVPGEDEGRPTSFWIRILLAIVLVSAIIALIVIFIQKSKNGDDGAAAVTQLVTTYSLLT